MVRPLCCTGGPGVRKHDRDCDGECVQLSAQLPPSATSCRGSNHLTIRRVSGPVACCSAAKLAVYHCPLIQDLLTEEKLWFIHRPCVCNHLNALIGRVGKCVPLADRRAIIALLQPFVDYLANHVGRHPPMPYSKVYQGMGAKKRAVYARAEKSLHTTGGLANRNDAKIKMFVKAEGIRFTKDKVNPDCRAIQFRSPRYTLQLASHIKHAEHALYAAHNVPHFGPGRLFAKGDTPRKRAARILEMDAAIPGGHWLCMDASRFDAHVGPSLHELVETRFWQSTCWGEQIAELMEWQRDNRGMFRCKTDSDDVRVWYDVKGGRMSGDANTAAGNCVIMAVMIASFFHSRGIKFTIYCDGDDSVSKHDGPEIPEEEIIEYFRQFGMSMAVESRPKQVEHVEFCQARPVQTSEGWTMSRDPFKILSKTTVNHKIREAKGRASYIRTVALGELAMSSGIPVVQPFLLALINELERTMSKRSLATYNKQAYADAWRMQQWLPGQWWIKREVRITPQARESFARAWGVPIQDQIHFEKTLSRWRVNVDRSTPGPGVSTWDWEFPWRRREMQ